VILHRQFAESSLELTFIRGALDLEAFVVTALGHGHNDVVPNFPKLSGVKPAQQFRASLQQKVFQKDSPSGGARG
jgi:hypothetical protein